MVFAFSALAACAPTPPPAAPSPPSALDTPSAEEASAGDAAAVTLEPAGAEPPVEGSPSLASGPEATADDGLDADIAELSASTRAEGAPSLAPPAPSEPSEPSEPSGPSGREIVYRVTPKGLVIEVDGIHLRPEAKPFKHRSGAYGVELVVNAESFDGRQYWMSKPKEGPLSIAGKIESRGGKSSRFADQREGSSDEVVTEGSPRRFEQRWPGKGQPKLWAGQTVTLEVGLWGVRAESERERPVRRLFVVKMVAGPGAQAVITPPTLDWGS